MIKKNLFFVIFIVALSAAGCNAPKPVENIQPVQPETQKRFEIIQEEGETRNIGGITVLKDNETGKEYLIVTGLNGTPSIINLH